jgi:hypothetical protein
MDFFIGKEDIPGHQTGAAGWHAVDTAQVTAVSYRDAQIIYRALK